MSNKKYCKSHLAVILIAPDGKLQRNSRESLIFFAASFFSKRWFEVRHPTTDTLSSLLATNILHILRFFDRCVLTSWNPYTPLRCDSIAVRLPHRLWDSECCAMSLTAKAGKIADRSFLNTLRLEQSPYYGDHDTCDLAPRNTCFTILQCKWAP